MKRLLTDKYSFVQEIFKNAKKDETPIVVSGATWRSYCPEDLAFKQGDGSWYFSVAAHALQTQYLFGKHRPTAPRRGKQFFSSAHCVVLDDVGTKVPENKIPKVRTSWKLETSPGNFQYGYILDPPTSDQAAYEAFMHELGRHNYTDRGSVDCVHLFRVPGSLHRTGFRARLTQWRPKNTHTLQTLTQAFGVSPRKARRGPVFQEPTQEQVQSDPYMPWLLAQGLIVRRPGRSGWITIVCPWAEGHSNDDSTAGYLPGAEAFKCFHEHCENKTIQEFDQWCKRQGWVHPKAIQR